MEKKQLKEMSVQEYLDKYMLSRKIEEAVNAAVRAKTPDPVLFIVISPSISLFLVLRKCWWKFNWTVFFFFFNEQSIFETRWNECLSM